jgi:diadenylate cyclase
MNDIFGQFTPWSALDVLLLAIIIYQILLLIRGTRAAQILIGILLVVGLFILSNVFPLTAVNWMMNKFYSSFIIILIIIFQDDIRYVLSSMGRRNIFVDQDASASMMIIDEISRAAVALAAKRIGALIVLERGILLTRYVDIGVLLDARVSKEILMAIFHPSSPIHDGAVILQGGKIAAAGCFLPLTRDEQVDPNLGTRHRAAIGISEETDALVIIVSEEGASMALVDNGKINRKVDGKDLREALSQRLLSHDRGIRGRRHLPSRLKNYYTQIFGSTGDK